jgi:hypothetical protein
MSVLPEGVMLNYLARIPNPTPFINFMPPEFLLFGGNNWLTSFQNNPPKLIVFIPKDTSEYGLGEFGVGYGRLLAKWGSENYTRTLSLDKYNVPFRIDFFERNQQKHIPWFLNS